jgi:hypothetical protein
VTNGPHSWKAEPPLRPCRRCDSTLFRPHSFRTFGAVQGSEEPRYAPGGDLLLPNGLDTWVGSNLGLSYTPDAAAAASAPPPRPPRQQFHNVSINKTADDYFSANGRFPEKTVLVMQVFEAADKESGERRFQRPQGRP